MKSTELQAWLVSRVAQISGCPEERVDPAKRLDRMGLDSMSMIGLAAEIESLVGRPVPAEMLMEYRTIDSICCFLSPQNPELP